MDKLTHEALLTLVGDMREEAALTPCAVCQKSARSWAAQLEALAGGATVPDVTPPSCVHEWRAVDYWRDVGSLVCYCTRCSAVERREVPR